MLQYRPSWWDQSVLLKPFDFAVLGAGLIGKQIAIKLKQKHPKARVAMIDRLPIPYGASTRNAGFACFGSVTEIVDDLSHTNPTEVLNTLHKRQKGIQQLVDEFGADAIGFSPTGSYELFYDEKGFDLAYQAMPSINQMIKEVTGVESVFEPVSTTGLRTGFYSNGFYNPYEGMLNSGQLNQTITEKALNIGVIPMFGFDVEHINAVDHGYELVARNQMQLQCQQLIIANNAFAAQFLPEEDIQAARGQILLTKPIADLNLKAIYHVDQGYYYFRNLDNRILLGGGRQHFRTAETTYEFDGSEEVRNHLLQYLSTYILPNHAFEIETAWSGIMAMGKEKLPIVKTINKHLSCCVRMSGMGVALGPVLSDEVVNWF
jgi:glycine/D-amino acid oxidase-like deaminating enzyme